MLLLLLLCTAISNARAGSLFFKRKIARSVTDSTPEWPQPIEAPNGAPNVVIILLDDVGFGASSTFGGPVQTPELDRLSAQGLRYNRFHVTAMSSPTRAALLSGRNDHRVGFGTLADLANGFPGYDGIWKKDTATIADILRRNGYSTAAFGKWHNTPPWEISPAGPFERWPTGLGFEYFYGFMGTETGQWEPSLYRNTIPVEPSKTPEQGYHFTADIADEAIRWLRTHASIARDKPYFLYFAPGATHEPHQAPKEWIDQYRGQFDQGWGQLRGEIFDRQKKLGIIPVGTDLPPIDAVIPAWNSFSADERRFLARQMEVYAGFLAHTDYEAGRLLREVQAGPQGDNTLIFYIVGDNGASGEGGLEGKDGNIQEALARRPDVKARLAHLDALGSKLFLDHYAAGWAWAMDTPFKWTKQIASHLGATRDAMIVAWPAKIKDRGSLRSQFIHVNDIAATIYDAAGITFPSTVDGVRQKSLDGVSFAYSFDHPDAPSRHRIQVFEQLGNRAIYQDGWIAGARHSDPLMWPGGNLNNDTAFDRDRWELYHIDADFSEAHDLSSQAPGKLKSLQALFDREARKNDIYPLGAGTWNVNSRKQPAAMQQGKLRFEYYPGLPRINNPALLPLFSRSHRITADVDIPDTGADGVILSDGSRFGGFVLYVKNNRLIYENHTTLRHDVLTSRTVLPAGRMKLSYEFLEHKPDTEKDAAGQDLGTGHLYVDAREVAEASAVAPQPDANLGVGQAFGSPVSESVQPPFPFSGTLTKVTIELR